MAKNIKKRNWAFVLYPESAPTDWKERLKISGLMGAISPLHDKDLDPTGEPKKAHYHIILVYGSPTTYNNVKSFTDELNQPIPQSLEQVRGYYRYLTHKDNPDKFQYSDTEIETFNGFDIGDFVEITKAEVKNIKKELIEIIRREQLVEYADFINYVFDNLSSDCFDVASSHTIFFNSYLTSARNSGSHPNVIVNDHGTWVKVDENGEVIK